MTERNETASREQNTRLIDVKTTLGMLGITRSQLQNLYPRMHWLSLPRQNRRFSGMYVEHYAGQLANANLRPTIGTMSEFSSSEYAQRLINTEQVDLDNRLTEASTNGRITLMDTAAILNVGRMTVTNWYESGAVEAATILSQGRLCFEEEELRSKLQWYDPNNPPQPIIE